MSSIREFLVELFGQSKPVDKIDKWAQYLIDSEFESVEDLKNIEEEDWRSMKDEIPLKISGDIRKKFKQEKIEQTSKATRNQVSEEQIGKNHEEKTNVIKEDGKINIETQNQIEQLRQLLKQKDIQMQKEVQIQNKILKERQLQFQRQRDIQNALRIQRQRQNQLMEKEKNKDQNPNLSSKDNQKLVKILNSYSQMPNQQILEFFDTKKGTPRGDAILRQIKGLIKPPKPYPNKKKVVAKIPGESLPLFHYEGKRLPGTKYYTLIVIGQTGSGKTTLLDAFVNKLTGMDFKDNWRWRLVDQSHLVNVNSSVSQTSTITEYFINDHQNKFNIRIIDTPGFGDTRGPQMDDNITKQFENLFSSVDEIDYIILTVKATETRFLPASKYVYNRVKQIFGIDAKDKFLLMCTFADGRLPLCLKTLQQQNLTFRKFFSFNNSSLYIPESESDETTKFYWKMGMSNVQAFQDYIINQNEVPLSLKLSKEVLLERKYLQQSIQTSQKSLKETFTEFEVARSNAQQFQKNKKQIQENGSYTSVQMKPKFTVTKLNNVYQMCRICQVSCCQICVWPQNQTYSKCTYFNNGNNCPRCPGKCSKYDHVRSDESIQRQMVPQTIVINCKKQLYDKGLSGAQLYEKELNRNISKIKTVAQKVWKLVNDIKGSLKTLQTKALQPKVYTDEDFYQQMIQQEEERREPGYLDRVKYLKQSLQRMKTCQNISKINSVDELFPELKQLKQYEKDKQQSKCQIF